MNLVHDIMITMTSLEILLVNDHEDSFMFSLVFK
jgi:hypothetical protein